MILVGIDLECLLIDFVKFSSFEGQVSCPLFFCIIFSLSIYFEGLLLKQVSFIKKKKFNFQKSIFKFLSNYHSRHQRFIIHQFIYMISSLHGITFTTIKKPILVVNIIHLKKKYITQQWRLLHLELLIPCKKPSTSPSTTPSTSQPKPHISASVILRLIVDSNLTQIRQKE
jgi:hypothetical protein